MWTSFFFKKRKRHYRDALIENVTSKLHAHTRDHPEEPVNFRAIFEHELFGVALKQVSIFQFNPIHFINDTLQFNMFFFFLLSQRPLGKTLNPST